MISDIKDHLCRAIALAAWVHSEDKDKGGKWYIMHPLAMGANCMHDVSMLTLCFLHDIWEDHPEVKSHLAFNQFPKYILDAMDAITRRGDESYPEYIERVLKDPLAKSVKVLDLEHNMELNRVTHQLTTKEINRIDRYRWAWGRLKGIYDKDSSPNSY